MYNCQHTQTEIREKGSHVAHMCLRCGAIVGTWLKHDRHPGRFKPWDENLHLRFMEEQRKVFAQRSQERQQEFWNALNNRLSRPDWQTLRQLVRDRENGICQGCRTRLGSQAHHLTYKRLGHELIMDLAWLCNDCHEATMERNELDPVQGPAPNIFDQENEL